MIRRVLFVDDDPRVTDALKRALRKEPYQVLSANSAREALAILSGEEVDVVVSDERMPGMSGCEFLGRVAREYPDTIRIVLTGHADLDTALRAINEGEVYRFMTKPVNPLDLSVTLRRALQHRRIMKKAARLERLARKQAMVLQELEREHPGITNLEKDEDGRILIHDEE